ncbi:hypothetical protein CAEBREN_12836 [Caenorhabditis brenneri]|uniref:RING-Gid-type domain-containing protein n=1 Tax=Caenorhabditis brenneri TaxID=135651 RepID=G0M760_CAEBE|nr:hypothetical protein CAEBREN_12836 [Caenorhabditis brenneri]
MRVTPSGRTKTKLNTLRTAALNLENTALKISATCIKNLDIHLNSLITMRDELFGVTETNDVSVTGQILIEGAVEKAAKLSKDTSEYHKEIHTSLSKVGKHIDRHFELSPAPQFKVYCDLTSSPRRKEVGCGLIYDYVMCNGMNSVGELIKEEMDYYDFDVQEPHILQKIVIDLRVGDIASSLEYLERERPPEEKELRRSLQTQMITDCIEDGLESYDRTVKQLRKFKYPFVDDKERAALLVGALLIGKAAKEDARYKNLFDSTNREFISQKMTSFFVPYEAPLKNLMKYGLRNVDKVTELCFLGYIGTYIYGTELPIGTFLNICHSAFACPILKEQCTETNPPMRLVCGHVVSRDAIARLTSSHRINRSASRNQRHHRFKCPYCPREQYIEGARAVKFKKWDEYEYISDEEEEIEVGEEEVEDTYQFQYFSN